MPTLDDAPKVAPLENESGTLRPAQLVDLLVVWDSSARVNRHVSLTELLLKYDTDYPGP